jgi:hypothetical protein
LLFSFFEWCEATGLGQTIRRSLWLFPAIEAAHLIGLGTLAGSVLIVDLRLLGLGLKRQRIAEVADGARPWMVASVLLMIVTGILLFLSESIKAYYNTSFWVKMLTLPVAIAFTFLVRGRIIHNKALHTSGRTRLLGVISMALWFTVAAAGRWIGFS